MAVAKKNEESLGLYQKLLKIQQQLTRQPMLVLHMIQEKLTLITLQVQYCYQLNTALPQQQILLI